MSLPNVPPLRSQNQPPEPPVSEQEPPVSERISRKDLIIRMHNDIYMLKQVRKALTDIEESFANDKRKAGYQLYLLRKMIDQQPSRRKPWSTYRQLVLEEFDEEPPLTYTEADRSFDSSAGMGE